MFSHCSSPLASRSDNQAYLWLLRRFRTLTSPLSLMPRVDQNRAGMTRWVRLTDTKKAQPLALADVSAIARHGGFFTTRKW
jgi:hypothetical protein